MKALISALALLAAAPVLQAADTAAEPSLKQQLATTPLTGITIPTMTMDQATLGDALTIFTQQVEKQSKTGLKLQWVFKDLDADAWKHTITLNAKGQTAAKLLNEIRTQAKVEAKLEEHAIVIRPLTAPK